MAAERRDQLLAIVKAELNNGQIYEADLREDKYHLDGLCEAGRVYVNPAPAVVETLVHELIHRAKPGWGEKRVLRESRRLVAKMTETEVRRWYRKYQLVAVRRRRPLRLD